MMKFILSRNIEHSIIPIYVIEGGEKEVGGSKDCEVKVEHVVRVRMG